MEVYLIGEDHNEGVNDPLPNADVCLVEREIPDQDYATEDDKIDLNLLFKYYPVEGIHAHFGFHRNERASWDRKSQRFQKYIHHFRKEHKACMLCLDYLSLHSTKCFHLPLPLSASSTIRRKSVRRSDWNQTPMETFSSIFTCFSNV